MRKREWEKVPRSLRSHEFFWQTTNQSGLVTLNLRIHHFYSLLFYLLLLSIVGLFCPKIISMLKKKKTLLHSNGKWEMICLGQARVIHYSWIQLGPLILPHAAISLMGKWPSEVVLLKASLSTGPVVLAPGWTRTDGAAAKQQVSLLLHWLDEDNLTSVQTQESRSVATFAQPYANLNAPWKWHPWVSPETQEQRNWRNQQKTPFLFFSLSLNNCNYVRS